MAKDYLVKQYHALCFLTSYIGVCFFAKEISQIEQLIKLGKIQKLPNIHQFVEGIFKV